MLFEIHQPLANREAFAVLAERFRSIAKGFQFGVEHHPPMGAAMDPDNPLLRLVITATTLAMPAFLFVADVLGENPCGNR